MTAPASIPPTAPLRIGTRASTLALTQSGQVGEQLVAGTDREVQLVHVSTHGDRDRTSLLSQIGGTGVFVTAVRQALLDGEVDAIVHSCKDLPTQPLEEITLACIPPREDPRDALCARDGLTLAQLPTGARVGTGSPRRGAQLLHARPDLEVVPIRGNVETRLARALGPEADLDAVILAASGLLRVGRGEVISELLPIEVMLPAPAQGALAVEVRTSDLDGDAPAWFAPRLGAVDDAATRAAVTAERMLLRALEAGCSAPVAAYATLAEGTLHLRALAIRPDGSHVVSGELSMPFTDPAQAEQTEQTGQVAQTEQTGQIAQTEQVAQAAQLGADLAAQLLDQGAGEILAEAKA